MKRFFYTFIAILFLALPAGKIIASDTNGAIDNISKLAKICHDATCNTFGVINFKPTINSNTPGALSLAVTDSGISGNAWGDEIGWINFKPTGYGVVINPTTGVLSGYAFASSGSWINFAPTGQGVRINSTGEFIGWTWVSGAYGGWLRFDCSDIATCVKTDWRPISAREVIINTSGGSHGGGYIVPPNPTPLGVVQSNNPSFPQPQPEQTPQVVNGKNNFDMNNDGKPDTLTPEIKISTPDFIKKDDSTIGSYKEVFPILALKYSKEKQCVFCVLIHTPSEVNKKPILKIGFVPVSMEIRIPISKILNTNNIFDVDGTSVLIIALFIFLLSKGISFLFML